VTIPPPTTAGVIVIAYSKRAPFPSVWFGSTHAEDGQACRGQPSVPEAWPTSNLPGTPGS